MNKNIFLRAFDLKYSVGITLSVLVVSLLSADLSQQKNFLHYSHKVHFCVLQRSQNKQR